MDYSGSYQHSGGFGMAASSSSSMMSETEFQRLSQTVGTNIQKMIQNISSIKRMIAQIGTPQDDPRFQQELHQVQHYTGQLTKDTARHLGELKTLPLVADNRRWRLQKERLKDSFAKALNNFQDAQRTAAEREKEAIKRARQVAESSMLPGPSAAAVTQCLIDIDDDSSSSAKLTIKNQESLSTQIQFEEETNMQHRENSIRQLESDIIDVNTIFKDLATMVHEQGQRVDSIEQNVESTNIRVHEGTDLLREGEAYTNRARSKKCILCLIAVIFLIITIVIATNVS